MSQLRELLNRAYALRQAKQPAAWITLCAVEGSSFRKPGAVALWEPDGRVTGVLTGGCLERDLLELARRCLSANRPVVAVFELRTAEDRLWGSGSGCPGKLTFLAEPLSSPGAEFAVSSLRSRLEENREERFLLLFRSSLPERPWPLGSRWDLSWETRDETPPWLPSALDVLRQLPGNASRTVTFQGKAGEEWQLLACSLLPLPHLLLVGAGPDLLPLARMAHLLGWKVEILDFHPTEERSARFLGIAHYQTARPGEITRSFPVGPRTAVVVATHHFLDDLACLPELLAAQPGYLGVLGAWGRRQALLAELRKAVPSSVSLDSLATPAGLDLGGEGPEAVALSILAEAHARLFRGSGKPKSQAEASPEGSNPP